MPEYQFSTCLLNLTIFKLNTLKFKLIILRKVIESAFSIFEDEKPDMYFPVVDYSQFHSYFSGIKTKI